MRYILVVNGTCLASLTATRWAHKTAQRIEVVNALEHESIIDLYGVVKFPTLLSIADYGLILDRVDGYNESRYEALIQRQYKRFPNE